MNFLKDLNDVQREAVEHYEGPTLIIAGAGSGKTRVLTYRIAYLLQQGVDPRTVLALTFTNKAAKEMRERVGSLVGEETARRLWMGTFHSIFSRILRQEADALEYPPTFTIYDAQDSKNLIKQLIKEMELDTKLYTPKNISSRISSAKNKLITVGAYAANNAIIKDDVLAKRPRIHEVYAKYAARCRKSAVMDFDDLLLNTNILFRDFPDRLAKYQNRFKYILVDEYQDTNYAQYLIVKKLAQLHENVCVVGDDSQSIYAFRGAQIENILNFKHDYPSYQLYKLEQNYRSTQMIVSAANSLIAKNVNRIPKEVWSANDRGDLLHVMHAANDYEEGYMVVRSVQDLGYREQIPHKEMAILYRTHAQSRIFEEALRRSNIPYMVYGGLSFYQRKEVKDVLAYLRLLVNPQDDEAFRRVINYPARAIGATTLDRIARAAEAQGKSMWEIILQLPESVPEINAPTQARIAAFAGMIQNFAQEALTVDAYQVADKLVKTTGIIAQLKEEQVPENITRIENIEELLNGIRTFVTDNYSEERTVVLADYLENVALLTDMDNAPENADSITLMTVHSAKGLEFDVVYMVGMEENLFPSEMSMGSTQELEEERRLCYVAITRARKQLYVSYADCRMKNGEQTFASPSRFIREIDSQYIDTPLSRFGERAASSPASSTSGRSGGFSASSGFTRNVIARPGAQAIASAASNTVGDFVPDAPESIKVGMRVLHKNFGEGEVIALEGLSPNLKATVRFQTSGMKQLLLKFARLKIVG